MTAAPVAAVEAAPPPPRVQRVATGARSAKPAPRSGGTLLALCGVCPGAGTSYLSYLIALAAARRSNGDVLVCDTGGPSGALSRHSGLEAPYSLLELADRLAAGRPLGRVFADGPDGLRVLAGAARPDPPGPPRPLAGLLAQARTAHALTVIDCGTLARAADRIAVTRADRVAWVLPANADGLERANRTLPTARDNITCELLIARADPEAEAPLRALRQLADDCGALLVLAPWLPPGTAQRPRAALDAAQVALQAILGALQR